MMRGSKALTIGESAYGLEGIQARIILLAIITVLIAVLNPVVAFADQNVSERGSDLAVGASSSLKDGTFEYEIDSEYNATITAYYGTSSALTIPETLDGYTVVGIGSDVFKDDHYLVSVSMPDSIVTIDWYAFQNCSSLKSVKLSKKLESLGNGAFWGCSSLTSIEIPASLQQCGSWMHDGGVVGGPFALCEALTDVHMEAGSTRIPSSLLEDADSVKSFTIPRTVTEIGDSAFAECDGLTSIEIPDSVTNIDWYVFENCRNLSSVKLSKSLLWIGNGAFWGCSSLTSVEIPASLQQCGSWTHDGGVVGGPFALCEALTDVHMEAGSTRIPSSLLEDADSVKSFTIPRTVTEIGDSAFAECDGLTSIEIPGSVTKIGWYAFEKCRNLGSIYLPDSVVNVENMAFAGCSDLTSARLSKGLTWLGGSAFSGCSSLTSVEIPASLKECGFWQYDGVTGGPFALCESLTDVHMEAGSTSIPSNLLNEADSVKSFIIPQTVTEIGTSAFAECDGLTSIEIPNSVTNIDWYAFEKCRNLESISLPDSVIELGRSAFEGCSSMKSAKLSGSLEYLDTCLLKDCSSLESIDIPASITEIYGEVFKNCSSLNAVSIPSSVTRIDSSVFENCDALERIVLPNSVVDLGQKVFYDCDALVDVTLSTGLTFIPIETFRHCDSLEEIILPYRIEKIEESAFAECVKLTSVFIPRSTSEFGENIFSYHDKVTIYGVADTPAESYASENSIRFVAQDIPATSITLSQTEVIALRYKTVEIAADIQPMNFTGKVTWKSSNPDIVSVDQEGNLYAESPGETTVKLIVGDQVASIKVKVVQPVEWIDLSEYDVELEGGDEYQLTAYVDPEDAANKDVVWLSSDETIVSVDQTGKLIAHKKGQVEITVRAKDGSDCSASATVTVTNDVTRATSVSQLESPHPYENNCRDAWIYSASADAGSLDVTFDSRTVVEADADWIYIYGSDGEEVARYTGSNLAGQTVNVPGNTVKIRIVSDEELNDWGFKVLSVVEKSAPIPQKIDISNAEIESIPDQVYTGESIEPEVCVSYEGDTLVEDVDYTIAYSNNINAGEATVTISGIGDFEGSVEKHFVIDPAQLSGIELDEYSYTYDGEAKNPGVVVWGLNDEELEEGVDYTLDVPSDRVEVGEYVYTATGIGNYTGTASATMTIEEADEPEFQPGWNKIDGKWYYFDADGNMVASKWMKDSRGWVYLGSDGAMVTNKWVKDSKGWCYVGSDGYCITNQWKKDSKGWCYLDANGRMVYSKWVRDSKGWCYVGSDGYMVTDKWVKDSKGWVYLGSDGRMATNKWVKDSKGWCYLGDDGYAVKSQWKKDSKGWCYLDENCRLTIGWKQISSKWYYFDANGRMVTGTQTIGGKTYKFDSNGVWLR